MVRCYFDYVCGAKLCKLCVCVCWVVDGLLRVIIWAD